MSPESYLRWAKGILERHPNARLTTFGGGWVLEWRWANALCRFRVPDEIVPKLREFMASLDTEGADGED